MVEAALPVGAVTDVERRRKFAHGVIVPVKQRPVATVVSPNWLNIAKAVSRIRSRVRRGGFGGIAIHTLGTSRFVPAQRLFQFAQRFLERLHAIPQFAGLARLRRRALRALQSGAVELQSVPGEDRPEFARPPSQLRKRMG